MSEEKKCRSCGRILPLTEYSRNKAYKDGCHIYCKSCYNEQRRNYRKIIKKREREKGIVSNMVKKYCPGCKRLLPVTLFALDCTRIDYRACVCNVCQNKNNKK